MEGIKKDHGDIFLQTSKLHEPWYWTFRCLSVREKQFVKNKYRLSVVKSAERESVLIPPNSEIQIQEYADKILPYNLTLALLQSTEKSVIPTDFDVIHNWSTTIVKEWNLY